MNTSIFISESANDPAIAELITNRAQEIQAEGLGFSVVASYMLAQKEVILELEGKREGLIANRARGLRARNPRLTVLQSYITARNK